MEGIEVFLHIGSPKTGTSAIQAFFNANRKKLVTDHSCLYPNFNAPSFDTGMQHNHCLYLRSANPETITETIGNLIDVCRREKIHKLVISCEFLFHRTEYVKILSQALPGDGDIQCKVIAYLRREDHFIESSWKQWGIKKHRNIYDYISNVELKMEWDKLLDLWAQEFGVENVIVRVYEKQQLGKGLIDDFFRVIGIDYSSDTWNEPPKNNLNANFGFNRDILQIFHLNSDMFRDGDDNRLFNFFDQYLPDSFKKSPFEKYGLLSPKDRIGILTGFSAMNEYIARKYLKREEGNLFFEPLPEPDETWEPYEGLTVEKIVPVFTQVIFNMDCQIQKMDDQIQKMDDRIQKLEDRTLKRRMIKIIKKIGTKFGLLPTMEYWYARFHHT
jgi:hypothetical protein